MIKPTIGRVVWFHPQYPEQDQPNAAIVAYVHSDTLVNLGVFDQRGSVYPATSIPFYQGEGDRPKSDYCEWMPYQQGQAAKTEALEKALEKQLQEAKQEGSQDISYSKGNGTTREACKGCGRSPEELRHEMQALEKVN